MRELLNETLHTLESGIQKALDKCSTLDCLHQKLMDCFSQVRGKLTWVKTFKIHLDQTKDYIPSYYFEEDVFSPQCIVISNGADENFIFLNDQQWNLNDDLESMEKIAKSLTDWKALKFPKNVTDIKEMIENDCWLLNPETLPKLSDNRPADTNELLSWDDKCVLTGTNKENMTVITRQHWEQIVNDEKWLDNKG